MKNKRSLKLIIAATIVCTIVSGAVFAGQGQVKREIWLTTDIDETQLQVALDWINANNAGSVDSMTKIDFNGLRDDGAYDPPAGTNDYVARVTGWIVPKVTGNYSFRITSDDASGLWLSSDDTPPTGLTPATVICQVTGWTGYHDWDSGSAGKSGTIALVGGQAYAFTAIMIEGGGGDHLSVAWASTEAGIDDKTVIEDDFVSDTNPVRASIPTPADGAVNVVEDDLELKWVAPWALTNTKYSVYLGTIDTSDPNQTQDNPRIATDLTAPSFVVDILDTNTTYFWRVDCAAEDANGLPVVNKGHLWSFTTVPVTPVIFRQPVSARVQAGTTVIFDFDDYSAGNAPLTYAWTKVGDPGFASSSKDLVFPDAQVGNEGDYYCEITNASGTVTTDTVYLVINRLIGHWPFDDNLNDIAGGNNGMTTNPPVYAAGKIGSGVQFSKSTANPVKLPAVAHQKQNFTLAWWSFEIDGAQDGALVASGETGGTEDFWYRRSGDTWATFGIGSGGSYPRGNWYLHTYSFDSATGQGIWYINTTKVWSGARAFVSFDDQDRLIFVGAYKNLAPTRLYDGIIDDVRLYNYVIDEYERARLYVDANPGTVICVSPVAMDLNNDCRINLEDFALFAEQWMVCNRNPMASCP